MSILTDIFTTGDAEQAQTGSSQPPAGDADIAPDTPGYEPDDPSEKPPEMLMPGEDMDPQA